MKLLFAAVLLGAACTLIIGCAVKGNQFQKAYAPPDHSVIYVYRPYSYAGSLLVPPVTCDEDTARIGPGGYHAFVVPSGQQIVCSVQGGESTDEVEIDAQPHAYYVKEQIGWGVLTGHPHLDPMDTDEAHTEIQKCCVEQP